MRVVSLCPSLTELVFDLGLGDALVGITRYCVHPVDGVARVEKVGGTKDPDVERIVALAPDVVLVNEEENRLEDAERLRAAGLRLHASFPRTVEETAAMVRSIGAELGALAGASAPPAPAADEVTRAAERIARDVEARAARVRRAAAGRPPVRFAYVIWRKPLMVAGRDTFAHALLALAGGENVFAARPERYPTIEPVDLAAADPDLVLLGTEPFPFEERHADELARAAAVPRARFRIADGEYLSWHGSRTPAGIDHAEELLAGAARG